MAEQRHGRRRAGLPGGGFRAVLQRVQVRRREVRRQHRQAAVDRQGQSRGRRSRPRVRRAGRHCLRLPQSHRGQGAERRLHGRYGSDGGARRHRQGGVDGRDAAGRPHRPGRHAHRRGGTGQHPDTPHDVCPRPADGRGEVAPHLGQGNRLPADGAERGALSPVQPGHRGAGRHRRHPSRSRHGECREGHDHARQAAARRDLGRPDGPGRGEECGRQGPAADHRQRFRGAGLALLPDRGRARQHGHRR